MRLGAHLLQGIAFASWQDCGAFEDRTRSRGRRYAVHANEILRIQVCLFDNEAGSCAVPTARRNPDVCVGRPRQNPMEPRGAAVADRPVGEGKDGRGLPGEGGQDFMAYEVHAAVDRTQPPVPDPSRDLVRRDAPRDELAPRYAALLAI